MICCNFIFQVINSHGGDQHIRFLLPYAIHEIVRSKRQVEDDEEDDEDDSVSQNMINI